MKSPFILIADDDSTMRDYLDRFLRSCGFQTECLDSGERTLARMSESPAPDLLLLDMLMPGTDGIDVLTRLKKVSPSVPVIILSGVGHVRTVVEAIKLGAEDYLSKPFLDEELELTIKNVLERLQLRDEVRTLRQQLAGTDDELGIISENPKMNRIREIARQVAETDVPVLILGESGVGKEILARYVHEHSGRLNQPFVKVNCAALPHDLLESELFGYDKGAFTGAVAEKPGKFELAERGTILLDEIGEMSSHLQAKLLHVLQDCEYSRLGGKRMIRVHARVLASTNRRLEESVAKGEFREDLYFRLNVITIEIPPLRERREDIPLLCSHFIAKYREKYKSSVKQLPRDLLETFTRFDWPGNIRQLENTIKRFLILPDSDITFPNDTAVTAPSSAAPENQPLFLKQVGAHAAEQAERDLVLRTLEQTNWNRKQAARILNISYKALRNKLKKWNLQGRAASHASNGQAFTAGI
ncbi:MAG TPA: sigma-54 dependent transcriptional regulator [Terriglobia bacterium]|nr:sigma-54 dependent transcriptional regulator [Terriglobia bacterium]